MEFAKQMLIHAKVAVSPGIGFGEYGEGYVRVALVENEHRIRQAARNVKKFLSMRTNEPAVLEIREVTPPLRIAIAGLGTVGGDVVKALHLHGSELAQRAGREIEIVAVSARDRNKVRAGDVSRLSWTTDAVDLAKSNADVVVELIGGEEGVARTVVEAALNAGKHVVTGNKALLARHGARLALLAEDKGLALKFEAAIAGGIPIVKALRESLISHGILAVRGILNGTCNYILTNMEATGRTFDEVLVDAQKLGYAEADPTLRRRRWRHRTQTRAAFEPRVRNQARHRPHDG